MNMKLNLNTTSLIGRIGGLIAKYRGLILTLAVVGMVGYAGYLISQLVSVVPDKAYLAEQQQKLDKSKIRFDKTTITIINGLNQVNPQVDLSNVGKDNPFAP